MPDTAAAGKDEAEVPVGRDESARKGGRWGTASFVCGVLGVLTLPLFGLGLLFAGCALLFGRTQKRRRPSRSAAAGLVLGFVVICAAAVISAAASSKALQRAHGAESPPDFLLERKELRVDVKDLTEITLTRKEWMRLGIRGGKYRNPDTGEYTMAVAMQCGSCGEQIPRPEPPIVRRHERRESISEGVPEGARQWRRAYHRLRETHVCPKCKGRAFRGTH